jgi:hypothetical protein
LPAYKEFGIEKEDFEELMKELVFGRKYLLEREPKVLEAKAKEKPPEEEKEEMTTLEEIIATLTPLEKAILWAIGIGNYTSAEIYEEGNKKLKEWVAQLGSTQSSRRNFMKWQSSLKKGVRV